MDRNSKYAQSGKTPTYVLSKHIYRDVKYENAATYRVRNGYIFELWNGYESAGGGISIGVEYGVGGYSDGGALTIQAKNSSGKYTDTHKTVNVSAMKDSVDYLISNYGGAGGDLFTKLDAIQSKLTQIALYPTAVQDSSKPTGRYPCLQAPLHNDQNYFLDNIHAVYEQVPNSLLSTAAYPYVLDSLGFPGLMASVARRLDPAVEVKSTYAHYLINIAKGTQNKSYGGAGNGGSDPVYTKNITQGFLFDGTSTDIGSGNNLNKIYAYVLNLKKQATADAKALKQQISGYTIAQTIGNGAWLDTVGALTYFTTDYIIDNNIGPYANAVRDTWVDGRYVNDRLRLEPGATFDKYPTSGILIRNYTYTDKNGASHTRDVLFRYQKGTKDWRAEILYWVNNSFYYSDEVLPQSLILTAAEVKALQVDRNTKILPTKGFSYNCKVAPGTPFTHQGVTGISLPKNLTFVANGKLEDVTATVSPSNAYNKAVEWTSSNPNVVGIYYSNNNSSGQPYAEIRAKSAGTAVLTATTVDGRYKASTTITVTTSPQPAARVSTSYSPWVDAAKSCATHQVAQTRTKTVTTTPYVWNSTQHAWVLGSTTTKVTTETQTRAMTDAEWKACSPQPAARVSTSYSPWVDAAKSCATHQVAQTRTKTVTTTPYVW
ncbi:MAG: Ig-like domain-containing protein, partial [Arcanobacterium sp.]|nr:Ig-like domain-containing protein [Arcanobacterium sp.]